MCTAKVYVDFGNHPGKDRIPREAALCGCRVVTNLRGAAAYREDVELDDCLKFDESVPPEIIVNEVNTLISAYEESAALYDKYVRKTQNEFRRFETDLYNTVCALNVMEDNTVVDEDSEHHILELFAESLNQGDTVGAFRSLLAYRKNGFCETEEFRILEIVFRQMIGECEEAYFCASDALEQYPENYELHMCMAEICNALGRNEQMQKEAALAVRCAAGTGEEHEVSEWSRCILMSY